LRNNVQFFCEVLESEMVQSIIGNYVRYDNLRSITPFQIPRLRRKLAPGLYYFSHWHHHRWQLAFLFFISLKLSIVHYFVDSETGWCRQRSWTSGSAT